MLTLKSDASFSPGYEIEAILRGSLKLVEVGRRGSTCVVTLRRETATALTARERSVMERLVRGESQKSIAFELGVALTTVSAHLRVGLDKLGLRRWEQAVLAGAILERARSARDARPEVPEVTDMPGLLRARAELCDAALGILTLAEREVAVLVVDGGTNHEIAGARGVSERTVANQIASVFRKLRVHGRLELIRRLILSPATPFTLLVGQPASADASRLETLRRTSNVQEASVVGE